MPNAKADIEEIARSFASQLIAAVDRRTAERAQAAITAEFRGAAASPKARAAAGPAPAAAAALPKKRKMNLSPEAIAVRKVQGKYLGIMRALSAADRKRVSKIAHEDGVPAAIRFAAHLK